MKANDDCDKIIKEIQSYKFIPDRMKNKKQIKYLDEWGLDNMARKIVERELSNWVEEFMRRADNARFKVEKCNFKTNDLFFFTTCHDKLKDNPEETGIETSVAIRSRKRNICYALLIRQLSGEKIPQWNGECSHCGNKNMVIKHCGNSSYFRFCPDCKRYVVDTFQSDFVPMSNDIYIKYIREWEIKTGRRKVE